MTISNDDLFQLLDSAPAMRDALTQKMNKVRKSSREANFKKYQEQKQEALNKAKQEKEEALNKPKRSGQSAYIRALERKIEAERKAKK